MLENTDFWKSSVSHPRCVIRQKWGLKSDSWAILGLETCLLAILGDIDVWAQIWQKSEKHDFCDFGGPVPQA